MFQDEAERFCHVRPLIKGNVLNTRSLTSNSIADNKNVKVIVQPGNGMTVMNNPFINYLDIRFAKLPRGKINIRLTDVAGRRIVAQEFDVNYQSVIRLNVGNKGIKSGIYILTVDVNGEKYSTSVMRK